AACAMPCGGCAKCGSGRRSANAAEPSAATTMEDKNVVRIIGVSLRSYQRTSDTTGLRAGTRSTHVANDRVQNLDSPAQPGDRNALVVPVKHSGEADPGALLDLERHEAVPTRPHARKIFPVGDPGRHVRNDDRLWFARRNRPPDRVEHRRFDRL